MPKIILQEFEVQGRSCFPLDMLRYDSCYPAGSEDVAKISETLYGDREGATIKLRRYRPAGMSKDLTTGRWLSFGWAVVPNSVTERTAI